MDGLDIETFTDRDWQESVEGDGPIRFAMIGLGWWTRDKAMPAVENSSFCETSVVVSGSKEKAEDVAAENETVRSGITYEEFHDGAAAEEYDAIYVCTPNGRHLEFVETAGELDIPVLCEKPMEATLERAERLVDAAPASTMIAYRMHTEPAVRRAREIVRAGVIGEPVYVHGDMAQSTVDWGADHWRFDPDLAGYGASVMDLGVYSINTTRFVTDRDPVAAQSMMHSEHEVLRKVPDEVAAFSLRFEDDLLATCTASQNAALNSHLRVVGAEGSILIEPAFHMESSLRVTHGKNTFDVDTPQVDQMEEEFDYFADCLLTGREPIADPDHGLVDMRALAAVYEAAETGETVVL